MVNATTADTVVGVKGEGDVLNFDWNNGFDRRRDCHLECFANRAKPEMIIERLERFSDLGQNLKR